MNRIAPTLAVFTLALLAVSARAQTVLVDDSFDSEHGGVGQLNYTGFANFTVTTAAGTTGTGSVDLIGNGFFDYLPGNGLYLDLDGSTNRSGSLNFKTPLSVGQYTLSFDLAGDQVLGTTESLDLRLNETAFSTISRASTDPFARFSRDFAVTSPGSVLSFFNDSTSNHGLLLDNVRLVRNDPVPEPASLLALGVGGAALLRRRKRSNP